MRMPNESIVKYFKKKYPVGSRVELLKMDDVHAPPVGTKGTVMFVDDIATIHIAWDNGSTLGAAYGEDIVRVLEDDEA